MKNKIVLITILASLFSLTSIAHAQFFYFGRNKVQYTDFEWHVLQTEHFDIYYYPEMKDLAERGAFFAEEAYKRLEVKFVHSLNNRVPLIFYSSHLHFEQTNTTGSMIPEGVGGFFEFLKGRVVIPSDGSAAQFKHVINHELVHVFMHGKLSRVMGDHRKAQDRMPPLWFTEGLAEYWSTHWDTQADMVMRDATLNDIVVGLSAMDRIYGSFLMYKEGQNALQYIAKNYGEEKILLLMENFWKESNFSNVLRVTIGKTYSEFDEEWLYALKKQYYPLYATEDSPSRAAQPIVLDGFNSKPVVFEHDSLREVFFIGNKTGYSGIYKKYLDPRIPADVVAAQRVESATGGMNQSAWAREPAENIIEGERTDDFEAFHLLRGKIDISKNGVLAFVTKSGENDALHLYDVRTNKLIETIRFKSLVAIGSASWAPDAKRIVFSAIEKSGNSDLYLFNIETRERTKLTNDYYDDRDPAWSPDGKTIAFASDRTPFGTRNRYNLFLYDVETGALDYLTYGNDTFLSPAWSRDGKKLAFTCDRGGAQNIWMIDLSSPFAGRRLDSLSGKRTITKLTHFTTAAFDPAWTNNGDLVFTAFERFSFQIRMIQNVQRVADTSSAVAIIDLYHKEKPWEAKSIAGASHVERYKYRGDYSLDIAQSAVSTDPVFGTSGGAAVALSDLLGNDQYYFLLYNTAQTQDELLSSFNLAISHISQKQRTNYAYGIYRFTGRRYDLTDKDEFFYERVFGGYFALSYPLTKFRRIEASVSLSNSNKDADLRIEDRKALLLSNSLAFVHDNSLWGPSGPLDGSRFSLTLAYTSDIQYSNVNYYSVIFDYRNYMRLSQRSAFASRFWLWYNGGKEARRFVLGGSWDLRGWPRWSLRGEKLWLTSQELRFPFLDALALQFPFGGIVLPSFRGALFFDVGSAWDDKYTTTYGSVGGGLRLNFGGILVLRYDIGKRIEKNFSKLQDGLFHQFFFGWDF